MQTKLQSLIESLLNTASGFIISLLLYHYVVTPMDLPDTWNSSILVTLMFTVVSIVRSYFWRRLFNWFLRGWLNKHV